MQASQKVRQKNLLKQQIKQSKKDYKNVGTDYFGALNFDLYVLYTVLDVYLV